MQSLTRREMVGLGGIAALLLGVGCLQTSTAHAQERIRPPGAPDDEAFLALCVKCQKCLMVCETGVIEGLALAESLAGMSTPVLNFDYSWCNFCGKCYGVCPTGALVAPDKAEGGIRGKAVVDRESCIAWSWNGCTVCRDVCPYDAIEMDEKMRPSVIAESCTGCGLCEMSCPNASVRSFGESSKSKGIRIEPDGKRK